VLIGAVIGSVLLVAGLTLIGLYALRQKRRAQRLISINNPFGSALCLRVSRDFYATILCFFVCNILFLELSASWGSMGEDIGEAPKLKSARFFTLEELKLCTNDFRKINAIGEGGYGTVNKLSF
jgi:hypothetical protein